MKSFAVCYTDQTSPLEKWTVVEAESARDAANKVRKKVSLCSICGVYKQMETWRWT